MTLSEPDDAPDADPTCPVCGIGSLADIAYDVDPTGNEPAQGSDSRQVTVYSCGHRVGGPRLDSADEDRLDVERRTSEETVDPAD